MAVFGILAPRHASLRAKLPERSYASTVSVEASRENHSMSSKATRSTSKSMRTARHKRPATQYQARRRQPPCQSIPATPSRLASSEIGRTPALSALHGLRQCLRKRRPDAVLPRFSYRSGKGSFILSTSRYQMRLGSTPVRVGYDDCAPRLPTANDPTRTPVCTASRRLDPCARRLARAPTNASPAPVVSTTSVTAAGWWGIVSESAQTAPREPIVMTTERERARSCPPAARAVLESCTSKPTSSLASVSLTTRGSHAARMSSGTGWYGARFRTTRAPASAAQRTAVR